MSGNKHLFQMANGLPPDSVKPAGDTRTGFGPAPFLIPSPTSPTTVTTETEYIDNQETGSQDSETFYMDAYGFGHDSRAAAMVGNVIGSAQTLHESGDVLFDTIDVIKEFKWSHSPVTSMTDGNDDVPRMELLEHRILQNAALNAMLYNFFTLTDLDKDLAESALEFSKGKVDQGIELLAEWGTGMAETLGSTSGTTENIIRSVGDRMRTAIESLEQVDVKTQKYPTSYTRPYHRLYATKPTGFKYKLPYFSDNYKTTNPTFNDQSGHTNLPFQSFFQNASEKIGSVVNALNTATTGTYIEQPKYPGFPSESKSYDLSFPLLNTVSTFHTQRNWQLLFMLLYQNTPNRVNRSHILPPHLYEAFIPGVWYSRYAYISKISVSFVGSRRMMRINLPESVLGIDEGAAFSNSFVKTIIPDAYQVNLTVSELIPESQNYMIESLRMNEIVDVYDEEIDGNTAIGQALSPGGIIKDVTDPVPEPWGGGD